MFENDKVHLDVLKKRAYNLRWATTPSDIIPLTAADPDFQCAPEIAEAIKAYTQERYFSYGPGEGLPELKEALARYYQERRNVPVQPSGVLPVDSTAFGIYVICKTYLEAQDEAIIFDPVDFLFRYSVEQVGGVAVPFAIPPGTDKVDFSQLETLITERTKLICLCNPLNPTGKVFTKEELTELGNIACKHNIKILSDEIWSDIIFSPAKFTSIAAINEDIRKQTITTTGFSKSYGLAGLRIGAVIAHDPDTFAEIYETSLHGSTIHGANSISQIAAATALDKCEYWLDQFVAHTQKMRDLVVSGMNEIPNFHCIPPDGCYVAFVNIKETGKTSSEIQNLLYEKARVSVVPGLKKWFGDGAEGYIRICFSTSESILTDAISRIKSVM